MGLLILTAAFGYQLKLIHDRPIRPSFQTGLYDGEVLTGNEKIHWTGKRAVLNARVQEGKVELSFSAPLPGIADHPQKVRLSVEGKMHAVILKEAGWHNVLIPIQVPSSGWVTVKIETAYTFNPKKAKISTDDRDLGIMVKEIQ